MYDEWGNDVGTAQTWFLTDNDPLPPVDIDVIRPLGVVSKWEDSQVLPDVSGDVSLELLEDPFVLPGPDGDFGFGLKRSNDDWLVPLSNEGEVTLPPLPPVTPNTRTPGQVYNDGDYGGWDGHDTNAPWEQPPEQPPEDPPEEPNDCRDRAALKIQQEIKDKPDDNRKEHIAIVYRDGNGVMQSSPAFAGSRGQANMAEVQTWMNANGVSVNQITALVHNHPRAVYGTTSEDVAINRYPSGGDMTL